MLGKPKPVEGSMMRALDKESYLWLIYNKPEIAEALELEVQAGSTPEMLHRLVLFYTQRPEIAKRVEMAARYLLRQE